MLRQFGEWLSEHLKIPGIPLWASVAGLSVLMALVSIILTAIALVLIPPDYFVGPNPPDWTRHRHPIFRWANRVVRNLAGWVLILLGVILSLPGVPGQGLLTILLGVMLVEFPGKRRLEQRFVAWPRVHKAVNAIRNRFGALPLVLEEDEGAVKS